MRRPVAGAADSRFAIERVSAWRGSQGARAGAARTVIVMGRLRDGFGVGVTFRSNAYWTSLNRTPRRRRRHNTNKPASSPHPQTPYVVVGSAAMPECMAIVCRAPHCLRLVQQRHVSTSATTMCLSFTRAACAHFLSDNGAATEPHTAFDGSSDRRCIARR
jgi:hypothetical protein